MTQHDLDVPGQDGPARCERTGSSGGGAHRPAGATPATTATSLSAAAEHDLLLRRLGRRLAAITGASFPSRTTAVAAFLGLAAAASPPPMPGSFGRLPAEVRARATVVVAGTYATGRGPCQFLPDGSRRWALLQGFRATRVYRGAVRAGYIGVTSAAGTGIDGERFPLVEGREYLVLLRPSPDAIRRLGRRGGSPSPRDALQPEEIVAIVEP